MLCTDRHCLSAKCASDVTTLWHIAFRHASVAHSCGMGHGYGVWDTVPWLLTGSEACFLDEMESS